MSQQIGDFSPWAIQLWQDAAYDGDRFTVRYGTQLWSDLDYQDASSRLGEAIMHALSCDGAINNGEL